MPDGTAHSVRGGATNRRRGLCHDDQERCCHTRRPDASRPFVATVLGRRGDRARLLEHDAGRERRGLMAVAVVHQGHGQVDTRLIRSGGCMDVRVQQRGHCLYQREGGYGRACAGTTESATEHGEKGIPGHPAIVSGMRRPRLT